ncbi:hypothetical protein EVAR_93041_1 [Eumeta japonica]|uniref:Uncharacterized protein n=1 Tax=Eumeta variegata TaxID=151549 RepID=A0A4C1TFZ2_EUMVA|nr:hypothetical protein EVAR_93041_1 [Eumeta japonica]
MNFPYLRIHSINLFRDNPDFPMVCGACLPFNDDIFPTSCHRHSNVKQNAPLKRLVDTASETTIITKYEVGVRVVRAAIECEDSSYSVGNRRGARRTRLPQVTHGHVDDDDSEIAADDELRLTDRVVYRN